MFDRLRRRVDVLRVHESESEVRHAAHLPRLRALLLECDQKKKELEALLARVPAAGLPKGDLAPARPANPLHDQVYSLKDSGKTVFDICSATGLEKGEVELILGLRNMRS